MMLLFTWWEKNLFPAQPLCSKSCMTNAVILLLDCIKNHHVPCQAASRQKEPLCLFNEPCAWLTHKHTQSLKHSAVLGWVQMLIFTFFPGLRDDVSSALAHDPGHIQRTVGLAGDGDGTEHRLRLQLQKGRDIVVDLEMFFPFGFSQIKLQVSEPQQIMYFWCSIT